MSDLAPQAERPTVSIARCEDYGAASVEAALSLALHPLGGMAAFVSPGDRVLLKVNLLSRAEPERAVTTHPEVVRALIREVHRAGGSAIVGDSPGGRVSSTALARIWETSGIGAVCSEEGAEIISFEDAAVRVPSPSGALYGAFTMARAITDCDVLISVPKFKTHGFMMFTGAVKNLFGAIPGVEKALFHLKVPERLDFADMLVDLMLACKPRLAVMDAVVGMEGDGPAGGVPRKLGALLASANLAALDVVASAVAGLSPFEVYTNEIARRRGIVPHGVDGIEVVGTRWQDLAVRDFKLPARDLGRLLPRQLANRLAAWVTARPVLARAKDCTRCRKCEQECPVEAIQVDAHGPSFDRSTCIRCYCCQELCPPQAIGLTTPLLARWLAKR